MTKTTTKKSAPKASKTPRGPSRRSQQRLIALRMGLESGTINTGRLFRIADVGYLEPGWHADILVLGSDPLTDITALRAPETVIKAGRVVARNGQLVVA